MAEVPLRRTIDRARVRLALDDRQVVNYRTDVLEAIDAFSLIALDLVVLGRTVEPSSTTLGSLDAIHFASALLVRDSVEALAFATHDDELGLAARATGYQVQGASRAF